MGKIKLNKIKNTWRLRQGVMVFDIETDLVKDWSEKGKKNAVFRCGVVYQYKDNKYYQFTNPEKLVKLLNMAKAIVSFNGEGFDFYVLQKHGLRIKKHKNRVCLTKSKSLDLMHTIQERRPSKDKGMKYPKLEELMQQHYKTEKQSYDREKPVELMEHCLNDVKYTKMLYEEKIWQVPIISRKSLNRKWKNWYDDDESDNDTGIIDDGQNVTYVADLGMPIEKVILNAGSKIKCPLCKRAEISLYNVVRKKSDEVICPNCEAVLTYSLSNELISVQSTEEYAANVCPNCNERLEQTSYETHGYGAGAGYISSGRAICQKCKNGCYTWENDETPGFRDSSRSVCCNCGN